MHTCFDHGYAVVIGVNENNINGLALPTVEKDVLALSEVLVHPERCAYKKENVQLLMGEEATSKKILRALYWLGKKVADDPQATAVIYYSGHGMVDEESGQYYLVPYDIEAMDMMALDAIEAEKMSASISAIRAERMLVIFDCCHAAGMRIKDVDMQAMSQTTKVAPRPFPLEQPAVKDIPAYKDSPTSKSTTALLGGRGRAILNSSTGDESSYIRTDGRMSLFTYHLIEALNGHAPHPDDAQEVLVTEVMTWVTREVKKSADKLGVKQTPVMRTSGVFPMAKLIGGKGIAKGAPAPDPLDDRPETEPGTITFMQNNQTVGGSVINIAGNATIDHIGDTINTQGGDYIAGGKK